MLDMLPESFPGFAHPAAYKNIRHFKFFIDHAVCIGDMPGQCTAVKISLDIILLVAQHNQRLRRLAAVACSQVTMTFTGSGSSITLSAL